MIRYGAQCWDLWASLPRMRGDDPVPGRLRGMGPMFAPHARG